MKLLRYLPALALAGLAGGSSPQHYTPTPSPSTQRQCGDPQTNTLFVGYDINVIVKSSLTAAACCDACTANAGCSAYSLVQVLGIKSCFLKSAVGLKIPSPFGVTSTSGVVSAVTPMPTPKPTPTPSPTPAPTPAPTTEAPTPEPTTETPTPEPTTETPTPEPTTEAPTPEPTTEAPTPEPTTEAPTPEPTTAAPTVTPTPTPTSAPLVCGAQLKNIYYHGFDLASYDLKTPAECCDACAAYTGCALYTHFTSLTTGAHTCYLHSAAGEKTNYGDSSSVVAVSALMESSLTPSPTTVAPTATPTPTPTEEPLCGEQLENIFYNDYTMYEFEVETAAECCEYCSEFDNCLLYTFYASTADNVYRCLLKSAEGNTTTYEPTAGLTVVSAFLTNPVITTPTPTSTCAAQGEYCGNAWGTSCCASGSYCQPWNDYYYQCIGLPDTCGNLETDIDYNGNDVASVATLYPWTCCELCQATDGCEFYTFWNQAPDGPMCYMKSSADGRVVKSGALSGTRFNTTRRH